MTARLVLEPLPAYRSYPPDEMVTRAVIEICRHPSWEKPTILLAAGYPKPGCQVPVQGGLKKPLPERAPWV